MNTGIDEAERHESKKGQGGPCIEVTRCLEVVGWVKANQADEG
jgi:hypothetical protein